MSEPNTNEKPPRRSLVEDGTPENIAKLNALGSNLAKVFELEKSKMNLYEELWRLYVRDCERFGIVPVKRVRFP
jgi:hypothetical protein